LGSGSMLSALTQQTAREKEKILALDYEELLYPPLARYAHLQGAVAVQIKLDDKGDVTDAVAISGSELLALAVVGNVKKWHFEPNAQKSAVIIYNFQIIDGRCKDGASLFVLQQNDLAAVIGCPPNPNP
jgi:TonB family protein